MQTPESQNDVAGIPTPVQPMPDFWSDSPYSTNEGFKAPQQWDTQRR